jgi:hypothetical protein
VRRWRHSSIPLGFMVYGQYALYGYRDAEVQFQSVALGIAELTAQWGTGITITRRS